MDRQLPRKAKAKSSTVESSLIEETSSIKAIGKSGKKAAPVEVKVEVEKRTVTKRKSAGGAEVKVEEFPEEAKKPAAKRRKTKAEKEEENMPLAARTVITSMKRAMYIGAHVSGAGGLSRPGLSRNTYGKLTGSLQVSTTLYKTPSTLAQMPLLSS